MTAALLSVLLSTAAGGPELTPDQGIRTIAELSQRNAGIKSYTFDLHVGVVVHMWPEVRFHLDGIGEYRRPSTYKVHFTKVPWFGKGFENVSMESLDPATWPAQYDITVAERTGDTTVLSMHDRRKSSLKECRATIDAHDGLHQLLWLYSYGGRIQLDITPADQLGFKLPSTEDAQITMPSFRVSAHADFTNYRVEVDEATAAP
jgi:hypothetical protein